MERIMEELEKLRQEKEVLKDYLIFMIDSLTDKAWPLEQQWYKGALHAFQQVLKKVENENI